MTMGETLFDAGSQMSPYFNGVIKSCALAIMPPAIAFSLGVQTLATSIYMNQCNPGDLTKAAGAWLTLAERNMDAVEALRAEVESVNDENWCGEDAGGFKQKSEDFMQQLTELAVNACLVASALLVMAALLAAYWVFLLTVTIVMNAFLVAYLAALATGIGAPAAAGIRASATAVAATMAGFAKTAEAGISTAGHTCAALMGAFTAFTWVFQKANGNPASPLDAAGASIANMIEGFGTFFARKFTMTPAGRHANTGYWQHGVQSVTNIFPTYQGGNFFDSESWNGGYDGGGAGLGVADGLANTAQSQDWWPSNPTEVEWS
ncbi:hypothetical protein [Glycomyces tritici]|uniref:Uncharacterized protein n=1 Tax=Glycomyces tritici TaxID=2665176 RepID=A0ABT7YJG9_9ACTN|nr:hypothetical protein [Glycomyces tritici]MDN3238748.1 hypothetical protein [Glycomyces tritici]